MATDITDTAFIGFLDPNKISYAKAKHIKSRKDGRAFPIFQLEINDPTEAEALISQNLACHSIPGGGISIPSFGHAVLQLSKFQPFG